MGTFNSKNSKFHAMLLFVLLFLVPASEGGILDNLKHAWHNAWGKVRQGFKNAWDNTRDEYPITQILELNSRIPGGPLHVSCSLDDGSKREGGFEPGRPLNIEVIEWENKRNYMKCNLWQNGKEIGLFLPLIYGSSACEKISPSIWVRAKYICKRQLYPTYINGGVQYNGEKEIYYYQPINKSI